MILVRDVFQLRFGAAREAVALWQEGLALLRRSPATREARLLTDLTGDYYTLVLETAFDDLAAFEGALRAELADPAFRAMYGRFVPLVQGGRREIFSVVGSAVPSLGGAPRAAAPA